jgi:hypothetical protein
MVAMPKSLEQFKSDEETKEEAKEKKEWDSYSQTEFEYSRGHPSAQPIKPTGLRFPGSCSSSEYPLW